MGGIKEKLIAAHRSGVTCVILPAANKRDFDDVPENVRAELEAHFADNYRDVHSVIFGEKSSSMSGGGDGGDEGHFVAAHV